MNTQSCCPTGRSKQKLDWLLWGSLSTVIVLYIVEVVFGALEIVHQLPVVLHTLSSSVFELINRMWWGILVGILMVAVLARVPREFVLSILGTNKNLSGILRATAAGVLLDLCSHGILMVGAKLYERGASTGQVMAFLIASPWNSLSLTIILISLIGFKWTLSFILLSLVIAILSGVIFDRLVEARILPRNPNCSDLPANFKFMREARAQISVFRPTKAFFKCFIKDGFSESRMVLRWVFFGVVLASILRAVFDANQFETLFGPTFLGLMLTLVAATVVEVCSEGSVPIAADIHTRASAPGNSFTFLMAGVSTDYTEIMVLKDRTRSLKIALFLPLVTVPQVLAIAVLLNTL